MVAFREASWNFPRQDRDLKEFRGFPGMELGIFRVAKSPGEGRLNAKNSFYDYVCVSVVVWPRAGTRPTKISTDIPL